MNARVSCWGQPQQLWDTKVCLDGLSKDVDGDLRLLEERHEVCGDQCRTLKTMHVLRLRVVSNAEGCDSVGDALDGRLYSKDLVHAFTGGDSTQRGIHAGTFRWVANGAEGSGTLAGITNAGTHRRNPFEPCQQCHSPGWMEGRLCGSIVEARDARLVGCQLVGAYRLQLSGSFSDQDTQIRGTVEASVVCECVQQQCIDFQGFTVGSGSNPRLEQGVEFSQTDTSGNPTPGTSVSETLGFTGLDCSPTMAARLSNPAAAIKLALAFVPGTNPTVSAFLGPNPVPVTTVQTTPGSLTIREYMIATQADRLVMDAFNTRAKLLWLCYTP